MAVQQAGTVVRSGDSERLGEISGSTSQARRWDGLSPLGSATLAGQLLASHDLASPQQHCARRTQDTGDDVAAPVQSVGTIDVEETGGAEHHGVPCRGTPKGMRRRVDVTSVRLSFGDAQDHDTVGRRGYEPLPEQALGHQRGMRRQVEIRVWRYDQRGTPPRIEVQGVRSSQEDIVVPFGGFLVAAGLIMALAVSDRIDGVDPAGSRLDSRWGRRAAGRCSARHGELSRKCENRVIEDRNVRPTEPDGALAGSAPPNLTGAPRCAVTRTSSRN